ncbi:hypothetical protein SD71_01290 [Cohnella kolymensis]|uniref:VanZ-like domain-containing protein n=1 Tax=Cohnella kolymensis TaxID=1590652 RepID=A0ABR5A8J0_9BACL|nr:CBO0543 family protein [Cohnella kolymensis]KIL37344.1 hypothetical protein SD71_01290 [Cohnella kolymensis]
MSIVKVSKNSSLPFSQKKRFIIRTAKKSLRPSLITMVFSSWLGTYLELFLTGKQLYTFEKRPFADIFTIDIRFTLLGIPLFALFILYITKSMGFVYKLLFITIVSAVMTITEKLLGKLEWITYSEQWQHIYSFFGYIAFSFLMLLFFKWVSSGPINNKF